MNTEPLVQAIDHVNMVVRDMARMRRFYERVIGMEVYKAAPIQGAWLDAVVARCQREGVEFVSAVREVPTSQVILRAMSATGATMVPIRSAVMPRLGAGLVGAVILVVIALPCFVTLPWTLDRYEGKAGDEKQALQKPSWSDPMGKDALGRSLFVRCLLGGAISLGMGVSAALISVVIGVTWGAIAGYVGGRTDAAMMRIVDVIYGLPYVLIVVLLAVTVAGLTDFIKTSYPSSIAATFIVKRPELINVLTLLVAIGAVSWLTMARVIRGQVLSLRSQPFVEAARACGVGPWRILTRHLLPNLIGPIVVYTTLTVPAAILQESFLSFLGIGVQAPLPSWGNLASDGMDELHTLTIAGQELRWWLIVWPCVLLGLTLLALNFLGDALRARLDPRRVSSH